VLASYELYGTFDLMGKKLTGHELPRWRVFAIAMTSYAFNLNLGAIVGGAGFRYRLYTRHGLSPSRITEVLSFSLLTNWLGYTVLTGVMFLFRPPTSMPEWMPEVAGVVRAIGGVLVAAVVAWGLACAFSKKRDWCIRSVTLRLPPVKMAALQLVLSSANWLVIGTVVYLLMKDAAYFDVVAVYLISAVAGAMVHVPGGLGVIEAVYVASLGGQLGKAKVLGAVLTFRALYYVIPLIVALVIFGLMEARHRSSK
jgi:uncharacterized membrane protein YbhN (UPF0104 family)